MLGRLDDRERRIIVCRYGLNGVERAHPRTARPRARDHQGTGPPDRVAGPGQAPQVRERGEAGPADALSGCRHTADEDRFNDSAVYHVQDQHESELITSRRSSGMAGEIQTAATLDDLRREEGESSSEGGSFASFRRVSGLGQIGWPDLHKPSMCMQCDRYGVALPDNVGYAVPELASGVSRFRRMSRCSQAPCRRTTWTSGKTSSLRRRGPEQVGTTVPRPRSEIAAKVPTDFEAGTLGRSWDCRSQRARGSSGPIRADGRPMQPSEFRSRQDADAEPAVPGWRLATDSIFA